MKLEFSWGKGPVLIYLSCSFSHEIFKMYIALNAQWLIKKLMLFSAAHSLVELTESKTRMQTESHLW